MREYTLEVAHVYTARFHTYVTSNAEVVMKQTLLSHVYIVSST